MREYLGSLESTGHKRNTEGSSSNGYSQKMALLIFQVGAHKKPRLENGVFVTVLNGFFDMEES